MTSAATRIEAVRAFNRFYTNRIGVLREGLHDSPHPLPEARVLFELGRGVTEAGELRRTLDMDAGQLSRLLTRLDEQGLVGRERSPDDARRQRLRLTTAGMKAYKKLDRGAVTQWRALLAPLPDAQQDELLTAMGTVRTMLEDATARDVELRAPGPGDLGWVVERHGALYAAEYDWGVGFEALVADIVAAYAHGHDPRRERCWIATVSGRRAGCIFCVRRDGDGDVAQLRLLLVEPWARGLGLGGRLIDACIAFARDAGYRELVLWTNHPLTDARRL